jgi:hypothetical protein
MARSTSTVLRTPLVHSIGIKVGKICVRRAERANRPAITVPASASRAIPIPGTKTIRPKKTAGTFPMIASSVLFPEWKRIFLLLS